MSRKSAAANEMTPRRSFWWRKAHIPVPEASTTDSKIRTMWKDRRDNVAWSGAACGTDRPGNVPAVTGLRIRGAEGNARAEIGFPPANLFHEVRTQQADKQREHHHGGQ